MREPSAPGSNGNQTPGGQPRARPRGAIRTHLGRKRTGPRGRPLGDATLSRVRELGEMQRGEQERLFDRMKHQFQSLFDVAQEKTAAAFDHALDTACDTLVAAGEFTVETGERLRQLLRRDLLQKDHPTMTFRTGDITTAGTLTCESCGWTIIASRTTLLPACPQCGETHFRKTA
jgi:isocitrate dehydrogenase